MPTVGMREAAEIEQSLAAHGSNGGLIVTAGGFSVNHPDLLVALAARYKLPAVYPFRFFVDAGGLVSYRPDPIEPYRHAAGYVDRILNGEKPTELPVQAPVKYPIGGQSKDGDGSGTYPATSPAPSRRRSDRMTHQSDLDGERTHSVLMFAVRITLLHFSISEAMSLLKSADDPGKTSAPSSAKRACSFGSTNPALISSLRT